jgi:MFS family permease
MVQAASGVARRGAGVESCHIDELLPFIDRTLPTRPTAAGRAIMGISMGGGMAATGPFLGGLLTTEASWRWAFLINVPIGAVIVIGLLTVVPETSVPGTRRGVDVPGQITLIIGVAALMFGSTCGCFRSPASVRATSRR